MEERREELKECFAEVDKNADGVIQFEEFETLLHNLGSELTDSECRIGFKEVDADNNGEISFDEFATWWLEH